MDMLSEKQGRRYAIRLVIMTLILLQQLWLAMTVRDAFHGPMDQAAIHHLSFLSSSDRARKGSIWSAGDATTTYHDDLTSLPIQERFLIFRHVFKGQGAGNVASGLLAAHHLGLEFNRTVCLDYPSFQKAFMFRIRSQHQVCQQIQQMYPPQDNNTLQRNNYDMSGFSSECSLKERLQSDEERVLYFTGNTYPRWPDSDQDKSDYFHRFYRPTPRLMDVLPWTDKPPSIVVHIRQADGDMDARPGLDDETLKALGETLSTNQTFLVTNRVAWYSFFQKFGWSHPNWNHIQHSALHLTWGERTDTNPSHSEDDQELALWADWYTLLRAKTIYHTPSDFSASTARWNRNITSWTILGTLKGNFQNESAQLHLKRDFEEERGVLPLVRRTDFKYCNLITGVPNEYKESRMANMLAMVKRRRKTRMG